MITRDQYRIRAPITKPGYGEPERLKPAHTCDPPGMVERCLNCPVPANQCRGQCESVHHEAKDPREKAPLARVAQMIQDGWSDAAICRELGITPATLQTKRSKCYGARLLDKCKYGRKTQSI